MQAPVILAFVGRFPRLKSFLVVSYEMLMAIVFSLPRFGFCDAIKTGFLRLNGATIGKRVTYYPGVWITPGRNLLVGDDVDFGVGVLIESAGGVEIGDRTLLGHGVKLIAGNHRIPSNRGRIFGAGSVRKPIKIGSDAWIGSNSIILPGTTIGVGAVVAAASVVTKDVDPYTVVGGNPARIIRIRN